MRLQWPLLIRRVEGESMLPTLRPGQLVIGLAFGTPKAGQIVIIRHDGIEKIKRIARIDGDNLYLLGDNPTASTDSRHFGWIACESVLACLVFARRL